MSETSAIDDKKKSKNVNTNNEYAKFFSNLLITIVFLGLLILFGAMSLYSCKVAQANILPTCMSFSPYTDIPQPINEVNVDINIVKTENGAFSTKLLFPLQENFKLIDNALGVLKKWTNSPTSTVFKLYIATTLQQLISFNFNINNTVNNFMNSMLPETWIILLAPFILTITGIITNLINGIYFIGLWFYNAKLLFSEKKETNEGSSWKDGEMWSVLNFGWALLYIFGLLVLFFTIGISFIIPTITVIISIFCAIFPLFMKSKSAETGKKYGFDETIKNLLKYKLNIIMIILSLYIISSANSNFGGYAAFVGVVACAILWFFTTVYHQYKPTAADHSTFGLGNYLQVEKICIPTSVTQTMNKTINRPT